MSVTADDLPIKRTSTPDQVAAVIRSRVLSGEYRSGMPLREVQLATAMGVSRNTVREGMRILVTQGLLQHHVHRGVVVAVLDADDITDIYEARRQLERLAIEQISHDESSDVLFDQLDGLVVDMEEAAAASSWSELEDLDYAFHRLIVSNLGSQRLSSFFATLLTESRLGLLLLDTMQEEPGGWVSEHRVLIEKLRARRSAEAIAIVERHLSKAKADVLDVAAKAASKPGGS